MWWFKPKRYVPEAAPPEASFMENNVMQRPCFALAVLLGSMATSMLMVRTVNSQSPAIALIELPGPVCVSGGIEEASTISVVLGQSVDTGDDDCLDETGGDNLVASDGEPWWKADSSLATLWNSDESTNAWSTLLATGYDIAFDFAMCGGRYFALTSSKSDIECSLAIDQHRTDLIEGADHTAGTTHEIRCEDYNYCLGFDCELGQTGPRHELTDANRLVPTATLYETDVCQTVLLPEDCAVWLWHGFQNTGAWAGDQLHTWWTISHNHPWVGRFHGQSSENNTESSIDDLFGQVIPAAAAPTSVATGFQEEVLIIAAADSLDQLGLRLQEAANQLRYWAADRIVMKGNLRRVAQKPAN